MIVCMNRPASALPETASLPGDSLPCRLCSKAIYLRLACDSPAKASLKKPSTLDIILRSSFPVDVKLVESNEYWPHTANCR